MNIPYELLVKRIFESGIISDDSIFFNQHLPVHPRKIIKDWSYPMGLPSINLEFTYLLTYIAMLDKC